jgi:1-acyl-sn-glycerol-3-phosphate acyltransferase
VTEGWKADEPDLPGPIGLAGGVRIVVKGLALALVTFGCLALLLLVRLIERPLFGMARPITPRITQFVCTSAFVILGIRHRVTGRPMREKGAMVANHASWLDIFALNAPARIYFVAKSEVSGWPGIGWLARATGTVFIRRDPKEAAAQKKLFEQRLEAGHLLLFFPEGTSTDSRRVLPFKPTLFAAFFTHPLHEDMHIQPVSLLYRAPAGADPRFYGWWGDMSFGGHLLRVLAARRQGSVELVYHPPLQVSGFSDRKALAAACEQAVREGARPVLDAAA